LVVGLAPAGGERQKALPPIGRRGFAPDQPELLESVKDAAEVTGVEAKRTADVGRGGGAAQMNFVEHPRLGERERTVQPAVGKHAQVLGVEAVEAPHRRDPVRIDNGQSCHEGSIGLILDRVKYLGWGR